MVRELQAVLLYSSGNILLMIFLGNFFFSIGVSLSERESDMGF